MNERIYLDYNATCPVRPEVAALVAQVMQAPHNASSVHRYGQEGRKYVEDARTKVATLVNANPAQVIFNSSATEGNNTVLNHFKGERILVSAIEHPSVLEAVPEAEKIPVTSDGLIDLQALEKLLQTGPRPALVSAMLVNNETGAIQPIRDVSNLSKKYGALLHCDAAQAAGKIPVDIAALGVDFMTLSAHKIGGPQGVGALVLGLCGITPTLLHGGGQEKSARAGTENVAGIAGFGMAAELALKDLPRYAKFETLRNHLEKELQKIYSRAVIHAASVPRAAGVSMFSLPGLTAETLLMALDLEGIAVSNGSACSSGNVKPSHVLKAMGASGEIAASALRISMGWATTEAEIDGFLKALGKIVNRIEKKNTAHA
ncbi:MAG TPA: cysteine desulfurase [Rhodospirillaceae bacterium]|nr:cysteine desulfurase [Rhodospirillaceae bacterium]